MSNNNVFNIALILAALSGTAAAQSTILGNSLVTSTATLSGNAFSVGGSTFVVSGGLVGVGTASPAWGLDVQHITGNTVARFGPDPGSIYFIENSSIIGFNTYWNGGWFYGGTGAASALDGAGGSFIFFTAPSGTGGTAATMTQRLEIDSSGNIYTTNWTAVTYGTGWTDYGSGYQTVQYEKVGDHVYLRGLASSRTNAWSTYPTLFTLPAGFAPANHLLFNTQGNANVAVRIDIQTSGAVQWAADGAGSDWISMDGINFSVQ